VPFFFAPANPVGTAFGCTGTGSARDNYCYIARRGKAFPPRRTVSESNPEATLPPQLAHPKAIPIPIPMDPLKRELPYHGGCSSSRMLPKHRERSSLIKNARSLVLDMLNVLHVPHVYRKKCVYDRCVTVRYGFPFPTAYSSPAHQILAETHAPGNAQEDLAQNPVASDGFV
jgi:hypothetical protein